jgi:hypothetical protein
MKPATTIYETGKKMEEREITKRKWKTKNDNVPPDINYRIGVDKYHAK